MTLPRSRDFALLLLLVLPLSGCGMFHSGTNPPINGSGSLVLTVIWTGNRGDPSSPHAVRVTLYRADKLIQDVVLSRADTPSTGWTAQLESGTYRLQLAVYNNQNAIGTPVASGDITVQIVQDTPQRLNVATGGTPVALAILPEVVTLTPGQILPLSVLGVDAQGRYLLLPAGTVVRWSVSDSNVVNLQSDGVARALAPGSVAVTASVDSLGLSANASVGVQTVTREWTILVFMNAANNLEPDSVDDMNEMEQLGSTADVNIVVQWKQANCVTCGSPDWVGTRRYYITRDNNPTQVTSPVVQELGQNVDMGDWRELRNFIVWAQERYPAERHALVVWNHGAGWRITRDNKLGMIPRSVSIDDHTRNEIQVWQLPQALNVNPQVDMLIFDASLMQMIEVAYEVRNATSIMVGSEESPPGEGYVYNAFLVDLVGNPGITPAQFGAKIVQRTFEQYGYNGDNTQSAVDLSKMETVKDRLNDFALRLLARGPSEPDLVRDARQNAESYAYPENKDLWDYADRIANGTGFADLRTAARGLQSAIEAAVIANEAGRLNRNSHGLSVYVPTPTAYLTSYANLAITRVTSWDEWLQAQPR